MTDTVNGIQQKINWAIDANGLIVGYYPINGGALQYGTFNPSGLPTTLPSTAGKLWNNNGVVSIS